MQFLRACSMEGHVENPGPEDAVVLEASCESFYWAGRIEATGATCFVLDSNRFCIITDSWNKTAKQDARNLAKALWVFLVTVEFGIPTVYKPSEIIRTLRRFFAAYNVLNLQMGIVKKRSRRRCLTEADAIDTRASIRANGARSSSWTASDSGTRLPRACYPRPPLHEHCAILTEI